ncbi:UNKNOWN [Stylonychia lemnae]|uniref:Ribosomal RNA-processing protein 43 n=1 Tax=Stylonychia lemnae TaxID=5949 RepID=A0A078AUT3_STYLE|nr:UNKNOWN [Stylonychia lemnae]|eukprot:CDW85954.1 UNKNOWN [Stylonychia lemnae]
MDADLLKKLLPHEYHAYLIRNGVRADSRGLTSHRSLTIKRDVLNQSVKLSLAGGPSANNQNSLSQTNLRVSSAIHQGNTLIIGQACVKPSDHAVLSVKPLSVSVQLIREIQTLVRRDMQEQKDQYFSDQVQSKLERLLNFTQLNEHKLEIKFSFNVLTDDGNLFCAITTLAMDLLGQIESTHSDIKLIQKLMWESTVCVVEDQMLADPTQEESYVTNNLLSVMVFEDGKTLLEKTQTVRTYTNAIQTLEQKPSTMNFEQIGKSIEYMKKQATSVFKILRDNMEQSENREYTISFNQ